MSIALNLGLERGSPAYYDRMEAEMIELLVAIKRHFEGDEQDLDVAAEYVASLLGIEEDVRAAYDENPDYDDNGNLRAGCDHA